MRSSGPREAMNSAMEEFSSRVKPNCFPRGSEFVQGASNYARCGPRRMVQGGRTDPPATPADSRPGRGLNAERIYVAAVEPAPRSSRTCGTSLGFTRAESTWPMHITHRRLLLREPHPESSRTNQPNNAPQAFDGLLPTAINCRDLLPLMPELATDGQPCLAIDALLLACELSRAGSAGGRRRPAG